MAMRECPAGLGEQRRAGVRGIRNAWVRGSIPRGGSTLKPSISGQIRPDTVTQRYRRLATRLGIDTTLHALRHYSATELIAAGVDPRTVAGRLGHAGGGSTTLRVYSAWVGEDDQRAAAALASLIPRPVVAPRSPRALYE